MQMGPAARRRLSLGSPTPGRSLPDRERHRRLSETRTGWRLPRSAQGGRTVRGAAASANDLQTCTGHAGPHLVVEIIPQHSHGVLFRTNNADAGGFNDPPMPAPGDHVTVTGPYVIDTNSLHRILYQGRAAENWAEIHPAWGIRVDKASTPGAPNDYGPEFGD